MERPNYPSRYKRDNASSVDVTTPDLNDDSPRHQDTSELSKNEILEYISDYKTAIIRPKKGSYLSFLLDHKNRNSAAGGSFMKKKMLPDFLSSLADKDTPVAAYTMLRLVLPHAEARMVLGELIAIIQREDTSLADKKGRLCDLPICSFLVGKKIDDVSEVIEYLKSKLMIHSELISWLMSMMG